MYKSLVEDPPPSSFDAAVLREAIARRLHRRAEAEGKITVPAVPSMVDEYVKMCEKIFAGMGIQNTVAQSAQLKRVLQSELTKAYKTSSRSVVVIEFPDAEAARRWYRSDDYQAALKRRLAALSQKALEAATTDLVRTGLDHLPDAAHWLSGFF